MAGFGRHSIMGGYLDLRNRFLEAAMRCRLTASLSLRRRYSLGFSKLFLSFNLLKSPSFWIFFFKIRIAFSRSLSRTLTSISFKFLAPFFHQIIHDGYLNQ